MVEDAAKSIEITEEDRMDMEALVEALIEVALAVEEGADPAMAGELVTEFLETNPEIADAAGAIGAALLDQSEGGGSEEPASESPADSAESSAES